MFNVVQKKKQNLSQRGGGEGVSANIILFDKKRTTLIFFSKYTIVTK